jgi:beta-1,2-mannobiose phosphorylase / 1,2-beta-oligomannan phosphorylase
MVKFISTAQKDKRVILYYSHSKNGRDFLKLVASSDGFEFKDKSVNCVVMEDKKHEEKNYDWKGLRISKSDNNHLLTYSYSLKKPSPLELATSKDLLTWEKIAKIRNIKEMGTIIPDCKFKKQSVMYFGEKNIKIAYSQDLTTWKIEKKIILESRKSYFDDKNLEVGNVYIMGGNILLIYYVKKQVKDLTHYSVGAAMFEKDNPTKQIWRSEEPLWETPQAFNNEKIRPIGSAIINNELILYWLVNEATIFSVSCQVPSEKKRSKKGIYSRIINKYHKNPIITPIPHHSWESRATFNSAAIYEDGKVHFVYRALGDKDLSVLGYAASRDGLSIDERSDEPIYIPREPFETPGGNTFNSFAQHFASGGGYGGIEDPRITRVENKIYLTYVAFDGANPPRAALSSIEVEDFLNKKWEKWARPKLISAPGMVNKSAVIFPRKVNGKYVVLHRVYPNILVDYLDDLEFNDYLQGHYFIPPRKTFWDSKKVGAGAPPMETKDGWLLIYQSVGYQDSSRYKIGAMMLDRDNPAKVLYRTHAPIIEPNEAYENEGFKAGVVYPCGSVIMNDKLNIYYGGADTVVCAATCDLNTFLDEMKHNQEPKLRKINSVIMN